MKEYNIEGIKFNYKKGINEEEFVLLINSYIDAFNNGYKDVKDEIEGFHKNIITAERVFNISLGSLCIDNFTEELHSQIFENGIYDFLKEDIVNVKEAYKLAREICSKIDSVGEVVYQFLNKIIELIPSEIDMNKLQETWKQVENEYKKITKE